MKLENTHTQEQSNFNAAANAYIRNGLVLVGVVFVLFAVFGSDVLSHVASSTVTPRANLAAATAANNGARCPNNADVTIGLGGLGTGLIPQLSNGVYYPTNSTPGGKYFGCMVVACRDVMGRAVRYVQQQAQAANGRTITVDILGHSAGADGSAHLARRLVQMPNVYVRRIVAADATPFAGRIPAGVGHVVNLNSTWNSKAPLRGDSPIQYVNRPDADHFNIDDLIPQNFPCINDDNACKTGGEEACKNKCSTTYTTLSGSTPQVTDCYEKGEDKAAPAIEELAKCVAQNTGDSPDKIIQIFEREKPKLKQAICIENKNVQVSEDGAVTKEGEDTEVKVPKACEAQLKKILDIRKGEGAQTAAVKEDVAQCKWKGAVICYPDTQNADKLTCKKKVEGTDAPQTPPQNGTECVLQNRNNPAAIQECLRAVNTQPLPPGTTGLGGSPFGGADSNNSSAFQDQNQANQCPQGYKQSKSNDGKIICTQEDAKDNEDDATKPQCLLVANTEEVAAGAAVQLQWRTANANRVTITNVEGAVEKSGTTVVRPDTSTTYTLTAQGSGDSKKTCSVDIKVVDVTEGERGAEAPKMSCTPGLIEKGAQSTVTWECTNNADSADGVGVAVNDRVRGTAIVEPSYNTQYEVSCKKGDTVIGKNTCAVRVGDPSLEIIANPSAIRADTNVRISWGSLFMKSCFVEGPRGFTYDRTRGIVITQPFTKNMAPNITAATYTATCTTEFGDTIIRDVQVRRIQ